MKKPVRRIKLNISAEARADALAHAYGIASGMIGPSLRAGGAPHTMEKFRRFMKSLEGAIRHAQARRMIAGAE